MNCIIGLLARHAALLLAIGLSGVGELLITVEWSFPSCGLPGAESESAVYGFPFPYLQWGRVSSLEFDFVPQLYLVNLAARALVWFFLVRLLVRRCLPGPALEGRAGLAGLGLLLCIVFGGTQLGLMSMGLRNPRSPLTGSSWTSYTELRPVGLGTTLQYDCSAIRARH